jgi:hypothetical protein
MEIKPTLAADIIPDVMESLTRNLSLADKFEIYDRANPQVYHEFKKFALELRRAGRKRASAALIFERIRWYTLVEGKQESGLPKFKMNNNYRAFYARKLAAEMPEFVGFFETREQKAVA